MVYHPCDFAQKAYPPPHDFGKNLSYPRPPPPCFLIVILHAYSGWFDYLQDRDCAKHGFVLLNECGHVKYKEILDPEAKLNLDEALATVKRNILFKEIKGWFFIHQTTVEPVWCDPFGTEINW